MENNNNQNNIPGLYNLSNNNHRDQAIVDFRNRNSGMHQAFNIPPDQVQIPTVSHGNDVPRQNNVRLGDSSNLALNKKSIGAM